MRESVAVSEFDIKSLRRSKQPLPTDTLLLIAEKCGFEVRYGNGTSHIRCIHTKYPDIAFNVIRNTKRLSSQRDLSDALLEVDRRDEATLTTAFKSAALNIAAILDQKIPEDLEYRLTESGNIVVTDRTYPQIGITFSQKDVRLAENKVRELTTAKRDYTAALARLVSQYDMTAPTIINGVFDGKLAHAVYDHMATKELPFYQEGSASYMAKASLELYQTEIENIDKDHLARKRGALALIGIERPIITCSSRRGKRHNHVSYTNGNGKNLHFTFNTFSNQRLSPLCDGTKARISLSELERLERIAYGIAAREERHLQAA